MPHLHLEYSANVQPLDVKATLTALNTALIGTGQVKQPYDVKSRARCVDDFVVGEGNNNGAFLYLHVALMSGRTDQVKRDIAEILMQVLQQHAPMHSTEIALQLAVEVRDMDSLNYQKLTVVAPKAL